MSYLKSLILLILAGALLSYAHPPRRPRFPSNIGVAPVCPYGYFDYAPYDCAPYGYYGPDWFVGGIFIGAGPWFHGPHEASPVTSTTATILTTATEGPLPAARRAGRSTTSTRNEARDGQGHVGNAGHSASSEHALPGSGWKPRRRSSERWKQRRRSSERWKQRRRFFHPSGGNQGGGHH